MPRATRLTSAILLMAVLAGCGADAALPSRTAGTTPSAGVTTRAAGKDAQAAKLITAYKAARTLPQRLSLIDKLGETDSDRAAEFLIGELERDEAALVPAIVAALAELDEDEVAPRQHHEGMSAGEPEAKRKRRRFNVWDIIRKYFKKKKRKGSGGGAPPAPAPAPPAGV